MNHVLVGCGIWLGIGSYATYMHYNALPLTVFARGQSNTMKGRLMILGESAFIGYVFGPPIVVSMGVYQSFKILKKILDDFI